MCRDKYLSFRRSIEEPVSLFHLILWSVKIQDVICMNQNAKQQHQRIHSHYEFYSCIVIVMRVCVCVFVDENIGKYALVCIAYRNSWQNCSIGHHIFHALPALHSCCVPVDDTAIIVGRSKKKGNCKKKNDACAWWNTWCYAFYHLSAVDGENCGIVSTCVHIGN